VLGWALPVRRRALPETRKFIDRYEQDITAAIAKTEDAREAQLAFKEKRAPVFKGR
jgi:hypothetical protein